MNSDTLPFRVGRWLLYGTLLTPLLVVPAFFFPYVTFRTVVFRVLVEVALGIFLWLLSTHRYVTRGDRDLFLWALIAFTVASAISAAFSPARNRSMFGDFERMGGGWSLLHFLVYYVLLRVFLRDRDWFSRTPT
jgi:hypothetical protein